MLTDEERIAIAEWAGVTWMEVGGSPISPSFEDPRDWVPLLERLAWQPLGMGLWRYADGDAPWICCTPDEDGAESDELPGGRGATPGEAVARAVLSVIAKEAGLVRDLESEARRITKSIEERENKEQSK